MQIRFPQYYQMFQCIASACPDSCCKEWEVDVDAAAAAYYRTLEGDLGERLRQVLKDTEDGTMMTIEFKRNWGTMPFVRSVGNFPACAMIMGILWNTDWSCPVRKPQG